MAAPNPLRRVRRGFVFLGLVTAIGVCGYRAFGRDWLDAIYMVVITVASVGFGEESHLDNGQKLFTIGLVIFGITAAAYTFGAFIQTVTEGELRKILGLRRMTRSIEQLHDHVIVCGYGRMGHILVEELHHRKQPFVLVDKEPQPIADAQESGYMALTGDAEDEDSLLAAGIMRARSLVIALPNDAVNVFITLTSRNLNPKIQIIARAEHLPTQKKLIQAGADRVILPAAIGAQRIAAMITHPSTFELMELVAGHSVMDVELDELLIPAESKLVGKSILQLETRRLHGLLIVAIKQAEAGMIFNPDRDLPFAAGDTIIVMGRVEDIERFRREFGL